MTIPLPDDLRAKAEAAAKAGRFRSVDEFICYLVTRHDPEEDARAVRAALSSWTPSELERLIEDGLNSGPAIPVDENFWRELDRRVAERAAARRNQADPCRMIQANICGDDQ